MTLTTTLRQVGLGLTGEPGTTTVEVGGRRVHVTVEERTSIVCLEAELIAGADPPTAALSEASLSTTGDTAFRWTAGTLTGSRSLAAPTAGVVYDAIFDLAKATCSLALLLDQLAELQRVAQLAAVPKPASVMPVTAAPPPTAAPQQPFYPPPTVPAAPSPSPVAVLCPSCGAQRTPGLASAAPVDTDSPEDPKASA